jgi:hypothetical protein
MSGGGLPTLSAFPTPGCRTSTIRSTTKLSWSRAVAASVWVTKKLISARSLLDRPSGSKRFTTTSGWSALWIMIWGTSIWRLACSNRSKIRSAQKCHPMLPITSTVAREPLNPYKYAPGRLAGNSNCLLPRSIPDVPRSWTFATCPRGRLHLA